MFTTHHPCWDAKNRFGLAEELPLDFESIKQIFPNQSEHQSSITPLDKLKELISKDEIKESELQDIVARKGVYTSDVPIEEYSAEFVSSWILPNWDRIRDLVLESRNKAEVTQE